MGILNSIPNVLLIWFDEDNNSDYNKQIKGKLKSMTHQIKSLFKNQNVLITLKTYSERQLIFNLNLKELYKKKISFSLIITSGELKKETFKLFENDEKVSGFLVFCKNKEKHFDAHNFSKKVVSIVSDPEDLLNIAESFIVNELYSKLKQSYQQELQSKKDTHLVELCDYSLEEQKPQTNFDLKYVLDDIDYISNEVFEVVKNISDSRYMFALSKKINLKKIGNYSSVIMIFELISELKIGYFPRENFDIFKTKILEIFVLTNTFSEGVNYSRIKDLRNIKKFEDFIGKIFEHISNYDWINEVNKHFRQLNSEIIRKFKYIFSLIHCYFFGLRNQENDYLSTYIIQSGFDVKETSNDFNDIDMLFSTNFLVFEKKPITQINKIIFKFIFPVNDLAYTYILHEGKILVSPFTQFSILNKKYEESNLIIEIQPSLVNFITFTSCNYLFDFELKRSIDSNCLTFFQNKIEFFHKILEFYRDEDNNYLSLNVAYLYETLGIIQKTNNILWKAVQYLNLAIEIVESISGKSDLYITNLNFLIGKLYILIEDKNEALTVFLQCENSYKSKFGDESFILFYVYFNLGLIYRQLIFDKNSLKYLNLAYKIYSNNFDEDSPQKIQILNELAISNYYCENFDESFKDLKKCLKMPLELKDKSLLFSNLAQMYSEKSQYCKSRKYFLKSIEIEKQLLSENIRSDLIYKNFEKIISILVIEDYVELSVDFTKELIELTTKKLNDVNKNSIEVAVEYNNLGYYFSMINDYKTALDYLQKAEEISNNFEDLVLKSKINNNIGMIYFVNANFVLSLQYLLKALDYKSLVLGENSPELFQIYNHIAVVYDQLEEFENCQNYLDKAKNFELKKKNTLKTKRQKNEFYQLRYI